MVEEAVEEGVRPIRSLGPLIHNAQEMERLGAQGVSTMTPEEADGDTIAVIRAHGVTPQVQRDLEAARCESYRRHLPVCHSRAAPRGTRCEAGTRRGRRR